MDEFTEKVRSGAQEVAERVRPAAVAEVRGRGDRLRRRRSSGAAGLALAAALVAGGTLAATRQNGPANVVRPHPPTSPLTQDEPTPTAAPSRPAPSAVQHSTTQPPHLCESSDLAMSMGQDFGALGQTYGLFVFKNVGSTTCRMSGYPKVAGVDAKGVVTTKADAVHDPGVSADWVDGVPVVDLPPGGYASADVEWAHFTNSGDGRCPVVTAFQVAPPSGGTPARVPLPAGEVSGGTDGAACSGFKIHPVIGGVNSWFFPPPYTYPPGASEPTATVSR